MKEQDLSTFLLGLHHKSHHLRCTTITTFIQILSHSNSPCHNSNRESIFPRNSSDFKNEDEDNFNARTDESFELENLWVEKDSLSDCIYIGEENNGLVSSEQQQILNQNLNLDNPTPYCLISELKHGNCESLTCNDVQFENLSMEKDSVVKGTAQPIEVQNGTSSNGSDDKGSQTLLLENIMQEEGRNSDEFQNLLVEKDSIVDHHIEMRISDINNDETSLESDVRYLSIEKHPNCNTSQEPIDEPLKEKGLQRKGNDISAEIESIVNEKGVLVELTYGNPLPMYIEDRLSHGEKSMVDGDSEMLPNCEKVGLGNLKPTNDATDVGSEVGYRKQREGMRDKLVCCSNLELEKLVLDKVPQSDIMQEQVHSEIGAQSGINNLISLVQKNHIAEIERKSFSGTDNLLEGEKLEQVPIGADVSDSIGLVGHFELEDGEIPGSSSSVFIEPHNSIHEHDFCEEKQAEKYNVSGGLTTSNDKLVINKNNASVDSNLVGASVSNQNDMAKNLKREEIMGKKHENKKSGKTGSRKTKEVKINSSNDSTQTSKVDVTDHLNAPDLLGLPGDISERTGPQDQGENSAVKEIKVREKKKRSTMTEERRSKRKLAKKRKRAEQNRRLGVKRLKLQPVIKPKIVVDCKFHLHGKCQQGEKCKFSHDAVPLTKSKPCTHYAKRSCLKGDDCPYDHELSKYPCCNYLSKGFCTRGDACLFSHQMATADGFSEASKVCDLKSPPSPHKTSLKQTMNGMAHSALKGIHKDTSTTTPFPSKSLLHDHSSQQVAEFKLRAVAHAPAGIRFISFGEEASSGSTINKQQDEFRSYKCSGSEVCSQKGRPELEKIVSMKVMPSTLLGSTRSTCKSSSCGSMNEASPTKKAYLSLPNFVGKYDSEITAKKFVEALPKVDTSDNFERSSTQKYASQYHAEKSQGKSMDASSILEEFLFSGFD